MIDNGRPYPRRSPIDSQNLYSLKREEPPPLHEAPRLPSTWSTAATPLWSTWNEPSANTRSPSAAHCRATPPASTTRTRASTGTTSTSTSTTGRSPALRARSERAGTAPTRPPRPRRPADRGPVHHEPVPPLPRSHPVQTTIADSARTVDFPPRELRDLQLRARAEQQTPARKIRYAVEGTINEFAHGHGMRPCRYRGQPKTYLQHVLMAIAVNIERLSGLPPTEEPPHHLHGQGEFAHGRPMRGLPGLRATGTRFGRPRPARPRGGGVPRARCPTAAAAVRPCPRRHRRCA